MCGIVGAVAQRDVSKILLTGLKRLEYRGYDSAGIAVINPQGELERLRTLGKVAVLEESLKAHPLLGKTGIAHTRWATHGKPAEHNAHPHMSSGIALVHNGIIENHDKLKQRLLKSGYQFVSETDTEVIVHLIDFYLQENKDLLQAVYQAIKELEGAYALAILHAKEPNRLIAVRAGSPLVIGIGIGEHFLASDSLALLPVTQQFVYLEEGDLADIHMESVTIYDSKLTKVERKLHHSKLTSDAADKGSYRHFMLKEIFEQPQAVNDTLEGRLGKEKVLEEAFGLKAKEIFPKVEHVQIIACGTSYHAGMVARYWLEELAGISCNIEVASEIRYRKAVIPENTLLITISQSGETADTLAALRQAKKNKNYLAALTICNVPESSLVRESDLVFMTRAGREIGVASTKAFTTQLVSLLMLTLVLGRYHQLSVEQETKIVKQLKSIPRLLEEVLQLDKKIDEIAKLFIDKNHALFLGRGDEYPIALEGALKLKEISYIHAEAYPAGELKHGPLALVDNSMPIVVLVPNNSLLDKVKSNLQEVRARGGIIIALIDEKIELETDESWSIIRLPTIESLIAPIVFTLPLQLLSYYVAVLKGTDVDQPRNLAKSVTVE
ncbi:MAG: glutamine--fructose-6-phosphate aminotransferase [Gammaproteobacteria bacterium RIFCSPHIGHO2_12_FULL_35_23]|nr:MAG: glutamine--fructose-6-phosphate aminotransferase [Gammaproteobacteria bacterium RIFCSPHIGHO2_12_FULL_35_23]